MANVKLLLAAFEVEVLGLNLLFLLKLLTAVAFVDSSLKFSILTMAIV